MLSNLAQLIEIITCIFTQNKNLQKQDAGLFIHGYPIKCEPKRQPIPISKKDGYNWKDKFYQGREENKNSLYESGEIS